MFSHKHNRTTAGDQDICRNPSQRSLLLQRMSLPGSDFKRELIRTPRDNNNVSDTIPSDSKEMSSSNLWLSMIKQGLHSLKTLVAQIIGNSYSFLSRHMCDKQSLFTIKSTTSVPPLINAFNSSSYRRQVSVVHNNHSETIIPRIIFDLFPFSKQIENYPKIVITHTRTIK